jgi:predicted nuclease with RNAse H fold
MTAVRSLGIDVSVRRGLDLVLLDGSPEPAELRSRVRPEELETLLARWKPDVVAIDSPPSWGRSPGSRRAERALRALGIQSYGTPRAGVRDGHPFYAWMKVGFAAFKAAAAAGFPLYGRGSVAGTALEVFPHASAVVLAGGLQPLGVGKHEWRRRVLERQGSISQALRSPDLIDAALAALTGLFALRGEFAALGDPDEGVIVLPCAAIPAAPYRRCAPEDAPEPQPRLPGLSPCRCGDPGCRERTSREFAPGHDAKRKALLWKQAQQGEEAVRELHKRRWKLPPGME